MPSHEHATAKLGSALLAAALACGFIVGWAWFIAAWTTWVNNGADAAILSVMAVIVVLGLIFTVRPQRRWVGVGLVVGVVLAFLLLMVLATVLIGS